MALQARGFNRVGKKKLQGKSTYNECEVEKWKTHDALCHFLTPIITLWFELSYWFSSPIQR